MCSCLDDMGEDGYVGERIMYVTFIELVCDPACRIKPSTSSIIYLILLPSNRVSHHPHLRPWNHIASATNPRNQEPRA